MGNLKDKIIEISQIINELDTLLTFICKEEIGNLNDNEILINRITNMKEKYSQKFEEIISVYNNSSQAPAVFFIDDDQALWAKKKNLKVDDE